MTEDLSGVLNAICHRSLSATSIMCKRIGIASDGFYGGLREDVNYYTAPNESILYLANLGKVTEDCRLDSDCDPNLPLCIAFDANANIKLGGRWASGQDMEAPCSQVLLRQVRA